MRNIDKVAPQALRSFEGVIDSSHARLQRELPEEAPVAIVFNGTTVGVMMATPADIQDFALGFALSEGIISSPSEISDFEEIAHEQGIEARAWLSESRAEAMLARRRALAGPVGCGLCGIESLENAVRELPDLRDTKLTLSEEDLRNATEKLRNFQPLHDRSRATHAAGFLLPGQGILMAREDVGRHNALDKLIGALVRANIDPAEGAFVMTSRLSIELIQKAAIAGSAALIAVSAPTAFAARMASEAGITIAAFARGGRYEIFTHAHRIAPLG